MRKGIASLCCAVMFAGALYAQRGGADWTTVGGDAHRSSWVRADGKISLATLQKPGFQLLWKVKVGEEPTAATTLNSYIGYRGFRSLAHVGTASGRIVAFDTDLGRLEWAKPSTPGQAPRGSGACPGGMTSTVTRSTTSAFPAAQAGRGFGGGRGGPAKSDVGKPGEGAATLEEIAARNAAAGNNNAGRGGRGGRAPLPPGADMFAARVQWLGSIAGDGMLHQMFVSNGEEPKPALKFLPANAKAQGLVVIDNAVAYAATSQGCGGAPNGVWALDLSTKEPASWTTTADIAGTAGPAIGPDGTVYATTTSGELVALEPKTLKVKSTYNAGQGFSTSPVLFEFKDKVLVAAAAKDGSVHLLDAASPASALTKGPASGAAISALASWQDPAGTRWLVGATKGAVEAWKVADQNGTPALQTGWTSRDLTSPLAPMIVNGVVFTVSNSSPAVLYALDGGTGKELWNSGKSLAGAVHAGGLSAGNGQIFLGTTDGNFYAFGFPIEH